MYDVTKLYSLKFGNRYQLAKDQSLIILFTNEIFSFDCTQQLNDLFDIKYRYSTYFEVSFQLF